MVEGGVEITDLERLARAFGLDAIAREVTAQQIGELLRAGDNVIAYISRAVFDLTGSPISLLLSAPDAFMLSSPSA